jgi:hypothetical protein
VSDSWSHIFIQNCIGSIKEIYSYFKSSSKRTLRLIEAINNSTKKKLAKVCDTRWIDRHACVITFRELYPFIIECFQSTIEQETGKDRTTAFNCLKNIQSSSFIVSLCILKKCLSVTMPVAAGLQAPDNDIMKCKELIDDVLFTFKQMRNERLDEVFHEILDDIKELCNLTGIILSIVKRLEFLTDKMANILRHAFIRISD